VLKFIFICDVFVILEIKIRNYNEGIAFKTTFCLLYRPNDSWRTH